MVSTLDFDSSNLGSSPNAPTSLLKPALSLAILSPWVEVECGFKQIERFVERGSIWLPKA